MGQKNIFYDIQSIITETLKNHHIDNISHTLLKTKEVKMGHLSSNILMILKQKLNNTIILAEIKENLMENLKNIPSVKNIEVVNFFINIYIKDEYYWDILQDLLSRDINNFIIPNKELENFKTKYKKLHFEFGSINPTGPVHLGHLRSITMANSLYNLCKSAGLNIHKEFLLNDCGNQIQEFMKSIYLRWVMSKNNTINEEIPYKGDYVKDFIPKNLEDNITFVDFVEKYQIIIMDNVRNSLINSLRKYGVTYDSIVKESDLHQNQELILNVLNTLVAKNLIAILDEDNNEHIDLSVDYTSSNEKFEKIPVNVKILLLTKTIGFEKQKVLLRNEILTYFAADILYLFYKINNGFNYQICFLGEDHIGHLTMLKKIASIIFPENIFLVKAVGFVKAYDENKELIPMSKRTGKFLSLEKCMEKIGEDFIKIIMLSRTSNSELVFFANAAKEDNIKNNPLFYMQYAYARINSVLRKAVDYIKYDAIDMENLKVKDIFYENNIQSINLTSEELQILQHLLWWDYNCSGNIMHQDMHSFFQYLYDLCMYFHAYFTIGVNNSTMRFITSDKNNTIIRLNILLSIQKILYFSFTKVLNIKLLVSM